jgi:hypothetical protein
MKVELKSAGNPDFGQDPNKPLYGCEPNKSIVVGSLKEAKRLCLKFIKDNNLGGGNWIGGKVSNGSRIIAYVSYNGRVWDKEPSYPDNSAKEIIV